MADSEGGSEQDDVSFLRTVSTYIYHYINFIFLNILLFEKYQFKYML